MNYSKEKIYTEAGLVKAGVDNEQEVQWIGTREQWWHAENTEQLLDNHDHKESGCECEQFIEDKYNPNE